MPSDLHQQKRDLRRAMMTKRAEICAQNPDAGLALRDNFLKNISLPPENVIAGYSAREDEMNPAPLMDALRAMGHRTALPVVTGKGTPLLFRLCRPDDKLVPGVMGILEPEKTALAVEPDVLLVPLLAFDRRGYRLGYGGGYYDRTLTGLRRQKTVLAIGIAFACQEIPEVPTAPHDARLDKIATETEIFQA